MFIRSFLSSFLSPFLPFFLFFLDKGCVHIVRSQYSSQPKKAFLSPHSPADRATPAVAKLRLPRGRQRLQICWQASDKGAWPAAPGPAHPTHVQERDHREILPGVKQGGAVFLQPWRSPEDSQSHTSGHTHTRPFKIPPFPLFPPFLAPQQIVMHKPERKESVGDSL